MFSAVNTEQGFQRSFMDIYKIVVLILVFSVLKASSQNDSNLEDTADVTTLSAVSFMPPTTILTSLTKTTNAFTDSSETVITDKKEEYQLSSSGLESSSELSTPKEDLSEKITSDVEVSSESARGDRDKDQVSQHDNEEESSETTKSVEEESPVTISNVEISLENTASKASEITREMEEPSNKTILQMEEYTEIASLDEEESSKTTASLEESSNLTTPNQEKSSEITITMEESSEVTISSQEKSSKKIATLEESSELTTPSQEKSPEITAAPEEYTEMTTSNQEESSEMTATREESSNSTRRNHEESSDSPKSDQEGSNDSGITTSNRISSENIVSNLEESPEVTSSSLEKSSSESGESSKEASEITTSNLEVIETTTSKQEEPSGLSLTTTLLLPTETTEKTTQTETTTKPSNTETSTTNNSDIKELSTDGIYVQVLGKSGKFVIGRTKNPQNDPNKLMVTFDSIQEKDSNGNNVGTSGRFKHIFNNFAGQKFDISELTDDTYQNLAVKRLDCTAYLDTVGARLAVQIYLFREEGSVSQGDEESRVSKGTLKFNVFIENWKFCGSDGMECRKGKKSEFGEFIDFALSIKGSKPPNNKINKRTNAQEFDMGGSASVVLFKQVTFNSLRIFKAVKFWC